MDSLLTLVEDLIKDGKYKKTNYEDNRPDGDYLCSIEAIDLKTSESGTQWFDLKGRIIDGEYMEQEMHCKYFLTEKTLKRSIGDIMNLIDICGYEPAIEMFSDFDVLNENLQVLLNNTIIINKNTSKKGGVFYTAKAVKEEN